MQRYARQGYKRRRPLDRQRPLRLHMRDQSRPQDNRPANGTYRDAVSGSPVSPEVARARFARWVTRALESARARGLTDREIARRSNVATSTFHRWRLAEGKGLPRLPQVAAFCEAPGASIDAAMSPLGMTGAAPDPPPEPPLPRDVLVILRRLSDPNVPETEKQFIRMTIAMLAERAVGRRREQAGEDAG